MKLSEAASFFIGRCFNNEGTPMGIHPYIGNKYSFGDSKEYKFTEEVLSEMEQSERVKVLWRSKTDVDIVGVKQ